MANNINRVNLTGNLTHDPELRSSSTGTSVLQFSIAVNESRRSKTTGEWEDYANYIEIVVFGKRADALARLLSKGNKVAVEGRLRYSSWDQEGQRRSKIVVIADQIDLMSVQGGSAAERCYERLRGEREREAVEAAEGYEQPQLYEEDIPF